MIYSTGCKTYFETLRRKYSLAQPEKAQKRNTMKNTAKNRQRKRRLLETRSSVVQTNTERELWKTATIELVSDEDAIVDGRPVWMVRSPPNRTTELSALCQVLQTRLEADPRYVTPPVHHGSLKNEYLHIFYIHFNFYISYLLILFYIVYFVYLFLFDVHVAYLHVLYFIPLHLCSHFFFPIHFNVCL
ncbi:hypothetical protein PO909_027704 [Leuciscus waleckii]